MSAFPKTAVRARPGRTRFAFDHAGTIHGTFVAALRRWAIALGSLGLLAGRQSRAALRHEVQQVFVGDVPVQIADDRPAPSQMRAEIALALALWLCAAVGVWALAGGTSRPAWLVAGVGALDGRWGPVALAVAALVLVLALLAWHRFHRWQWLADHVAWRGARLSMRPGAAGYVARAVVLRLLSLATLGLLAPYATWALRRDLLGRLRIGDRPVIVEGDWRHLFPLMLPVHLSMAIAGGGLWLANSGFPLVGLIVVVLGVLRAALGLLSYTVQARAVMLRGVSCGGLRLSHRPYSGQVTVLVALGGFAVLGTLGVALLLLWPMASAAWASGGADVAAVALTAMGGAVLLIGMPALAEAFLLLPVRRDLVRETRLYVDDPHLMADSA